MTSIVDHGEMQERITDFELECPCAGCAERREILPTLLAPSWWLEDCLSSPLRTARERAEVLAELKRRHGGYC